jgi:hypothetical protein
MAAAFQATASCGESLLLWKEAGSEYPINRSRLEKKVICSGLLG